MQADKFYVVDFKNPEVDEHVHYMTISYPEREPLKKVLQLLLVGRPHLVIDVDKKYPVFNTRHEADAEGKRLGDLASQLDPDRIPADERFPGQPNLIVEQGSPPA